MTKNILINKEKLEEKYLIIFKYTVIVLMSAALVSIPLLLVRAAYHGLQTPSIPEPIKQAPTKNIDINDLKQYLLQQEKIRLDNEKIEEEKKKRAAQGDPLADEGKTIDATKAIVMPKFEQYVLPMYTCLRNFEIAVAFDGKVADLTSERMVLEREEIRKRIVSYSNDRFHGEAWVAELSVFMCNFLQNPEIISLRKTAKISKVVLTGIAFHSDAWGKNTKEKIEFDSAEKNRFNAEMNAELSRVASAKVSALMTLGVAASAFGIFLVLALYLIFAKIENNLASISHEIRKYKQSE